MTETVTRASCVVRWEGDNLADIIKFFGNIPVRLEVLDGQLRLIVRPTDGITLEGGATELDIFLREGDGLAYIHGGIDVIRELMYSDERPKHGDTIH